MGLTRYRRSRFAQITMNEVSDEDEKKHEQWINKKADLWEEITQFENQLLQIKQDIKNTPKHILMAELDEADKFHQLSSDRKRLVDTIKMIAYRAETAMAQLIKDDVVDMAGARSILQDLYMTDADLLPNIEDKLLIVQLHGASRPAINRKIKYLIDHLNEADITYPGTDLKIRYELSAYMLNETMDEEIIGATVNSVK